MKKFIVACLLFFTLAGALFAQQHLTVDLSHPVYQIIENAEARGILPLLPAAKPYSRSTISRLLDDILAERAKLTPYEVTILNRYRKEMSEPTKGWKNGKVSADGKFGSFNIGITEESQIRDNINNLSNFQMTNQLRFNFEGDIMKFCSYRASLGASVDRISPDFTYKSSVMYGLYNQPTAIGTYAPYHYDKTWDGFHLGLSGSNTDGVGQFKIGFLMDNEISMQFWEDALILRFGLFRREWGKGDGSLDLSATARPFEGIEIHINPVDWFSYSYVVGSLGDWFTDSFNDGTSEQKNYTLQNLEFMPWKWLYIGATGSVVWGKRLELGYLCPLGIGVIQQNLQGDFDNVGMTINAAGVIPYVGKLHASLFIDEFRLASPTNARNMFSIQAGLDFPVPKLPFTTFKFQYTKIEPFTYTHYDEDSYPFFRSATSVNMAYTNDGQNLAYYLPPNSDEFLFRLESVPHPQITAGISYKLIRHGTNSYSGSSNNGLIYGDMDIPISYAWWDAGNSYQKDFLNDGIYDWTNMATLDVTFRFENFPMQIGFEYIFSYTFWDANATGLTAPSPVTQNIVALTVTLFP